ncbi:hypothetical protein C8R47DRAFT_216129 [Mycena vitilis]|nr:hypothetical protein C8R47DRAFT_216129 [Mycena vitilis]
MQDLARQRSRSSILSWWSDSKPPGATVNLHAIAKPLMRFMYHRQALGFIKNNAHGTLSSDLLKVYSVYLSCKYVSLATKAAVLKELRRLTHEDGPCTVILDNEPVLLQVVELAAPGLANTLKIEACGILRNIAQSRSASQSQRTELCRSLVPLMLDKDLIIAELAREAISSVAVNHKAAGVSIINAKAADYLERLLKPESTDSARSCTWAMIKQLASHEITAPVILPFILRGQ